MYSSKNKISLLLLLLTCQSNLTITGWLWVNSNNDNEMTEYDIPGIGKTIPKKIGEFIDHIMSQNLNRENNSGYGNVLILHGPPGNGKSTLAKKIAETTNSVFIEISAPAIVDSYIGSGPGFVEKLFKDAIEKSVGKYGSPQKVIIFIDEVDALVSKCDSDSQYHKTLQHLWKWIDKLEKDPKFSLVFATNRYEELSLAFRNRFDEAAVVEVKNPDSVQRKEIIEFYVATIKNNLNPEFELSKEYIDHLVKQTNNLSIRSIKKLIYQINRQQIELKVVNPIICKYKENNKVPEANKKSKWEKTSTIVGTTATTINTIIHTTEFALKGILIVHNIKQGKPPMEAIQEVYLPKINIADSNKNNKKPV